MISGVVPFEEIVQSVKDETGIENTRSIRERIKRLIFRAEREIGFGGSVELFKKTYLVAGVLNADPGFAKYFQFPEDFIEFEGIGQDCAPVNSSKYKPTTEGFRFKEKQTKDTVLLYWGIKTDVEGNPMVTRNHEEAVVAFIIWKLYTTKTFLGTGNMNAEQYYSRKFDMALLEARGDDAFPTLEEWNALCVLGYTDRRALLYQPVHSYDYCAEYNNGSEDNVLPPTPGTMGVNYWQLTDINEDINDVISLVNPAYLLAKPLQSLFVFQQGYVVPYVAIGRIAFTISMTSNVPYIFKDILGNNITSIFDVYYYGDTNIKLYVSKEVFSFSNIKFTIQIP